MTEEERFKRRQVENGILANAKNDPACVVNDALFSGKIVSVYKRGKETNFIVTCGHPGMKRNADGKIDRNIITVKFFGKEGEFYAERFHKDDFATFHAVVQTKINRRYEIKITEVWGLSVESNKGKITPQDINRIHLIGKITSAVQDNDFWASVLVKTQIWKSRPNIFSEGDDKGDNKETESLYRSVTKIRVNGGRDTQRMVTFLLTKGTIIDIHGHIYGRVIDDKVLGYKRRAMSVIADEINAVGAIQSSNVESTSEVFHPENVGLEEENSEDAAVEDISGYAED